MVVPATAESNAPASGNDAPSSGQSGASSAPEQRADPTQASGAESQERVTRSPDYVREAFARLRGHVQSAAPAPEPPATAPGTETAPQAPPASRNPAPESERSAGTPASPASVLPRQRQDQPPATATAAQGQQQVLTLTPDELQRRAQAEADRIIAKRQRDDQAKAERDREVEMRRTDPFGYARLMEEREQQLLAAQQETQRLTDVVSKQLIFYDRAVLDTFVGALPPEEQRKVIAPDGDGIENRKATAANTLKALRSRWMAEGRASAKADLMKDQTFVKEVLARFGQATPEPESVPVAARPASGAAPQNGNEAMNSWMRQGAQGARATTGR